MSKIEVFIPAYNCRATLPKTLASLAAQTDSDFYVCVVDDCGSEALEDICALFPMLNLRLIHNEKNLGCGLSRQTAIDSSDADYLIPLDSDDMLLPMAISIFKKNIADHPEADFFVGYLFNESLDKNKQIQYSLVTDGLTVVSSKMYKREFLERFNIRNCEEFSRFADDTYFNMLSWELGQVVSIPFPLYLYTCNPNSVTNKNGGKDYWTDVVPKFLRCIWKTTEQILEYKTVNEIQHLPATLQYIKTVVETRGQENEIQKYQELISFLKQQGYDNFM